MRVLRQVIEILSVVLFFEIRSRVASSGVSPAASSLYLLPESELLRMFSRDARPARSGAEINKLSEQSLRQVDLVLIHSDHAFPPP